MSQKSMTHVYLCSNNRAEVAKLLVSKGANPLVG